MEQEQRRSKGTSRGARQSSTLLRPCRPAHVESPAQHHTALATARDPHRLACCAGFPAPYRYAGPHPNRQRVSPIALAASPPPMTAVCYASHRILNLLLYPLLILAGPWP